MLHVACVLEILFAYKILFVNTPREDMKWKV